MKPLNQKEINKKFFDFMILFIVCVSVFSFALYYDFSVGGSELTSLREQVKNMESTFNKYQDRYRAAEMLHSEIDGIKKADRPIKQAEMTSKAVRMEKDLYSLSGDDTTNDYIKIFNITKLSMLNEMELLELAAIRKERIAQDSVKLVEANAKFKQLLEDIQMKRILNQNSGQESNF